MLVLGTWDPILGDFGRVDKINNSNFEVDKYYFTNEHAKVDETKISPSNG